MNPLIAAASVILATVFAQGWSYLQMFNLTGKNQ
jgi:hypothetical protein